MNYKTKDIDKIYTDIVKNYLNEGYTIYSPTLSNEKEDVCKIDLLKDGKITRIAVLDNRIKIIEQESILPTRKIIVGEIEQKKDCVCSYDEIIRNKDLDIIQEFVFYSIDNLNNEYYTDDMKFYTECTEKRKIRLDNRFKIDSLLFKIFTNPQILQSAYKICKKRKGYKTVKLKDIECIERIFNKYIIKIKNKPDLIIWR